MADAPKKSWSLDEVRAREALGLIGGPPHWDEVNVAHIDTGVAPHPTLGDWVAVDQGVNYMEPGTPPIDPLKRDAPFAGHGTRTMSVLTGMDGGNFVGVAPRLPVVPYRVTDSVVLNTKYIRRNVGAAIRHAVDVTLCEVISISLGFPVMSIFNNVLGAAVDHAYERGIIVVAAGGQVIDTVCYPGKFFRAIGVGGYTGTPGRRGIYKDYADDKDMKAFIDVWAPADPVWRANTVRRDDGAITTETGWGDGTSFATPHVAAAAAMWLLHRGDAIAEAYDEPWMRVEAFRWLLRRTAVDLTARGFDGFARVRPPKPQEKLPRKGDTAASHMCLAGGLDIPALLQAPLPPKDVLTEMPPARRQWA
ncbi:S8/S53 family peptidase [Novispirillum sp. DQ9]|uniref:S8/S53 family peptidase n=1 Tax=Novispirillum sp. DQ9 TaxID=3398612 RepID=UPI003C7D4241